MHKPTYKPQKPIDYENHPQKEGLAKIQRQIKQACKARAAYHQKWKQVSLTIRALVATHRILNGSPVWSQGKTLKVYCDQCGELLTSAEGFRPLESSCCLRTRAQLKRLALEP
jgi:hypothetical protein